MPLMRNRFGRLVCINEDQVRFAAQRGLSPVTDEDIAYAGDTTVEHFALPSAPGRAYGDTLSYVEMRCLGSQPVAVMGAGPSRTDVEGLRDTHYIIGVNARGDGPKVDAIAALDDEYWQTHFLGYVERYGVPDRLFCHRASLAAPRTAYKTPQPLHPIHGEQGCIAIRQGASVATCQITGVWALLIARWISGGEITLAGVDLSDPYYHSQIDKWRMALKLIRDVRCSPSMSGPVRDILLLDPRETWGYSVVHGVNPYCHGSARAYVIGNGPSAKHRPDGLTIGVNWRGDYDVTHTIASDTPYWERDDAKPSGRLHNALRGEGAPAKAGYVVPMYAKAGTPYTLRVGDESVHCAPACGVALAMHVTRGPIVLLGCEATDAGYERHARKMELVSTVAKRVYVDHRMDGEAAKHYPVWAGELGDESTALIVASGPSATREAVREAIRKHKPGLIYAVNNALSLIGNPTHYLCNDPDAVTRYRESYEFAERHGVKVTAGGNLNKEQARDRAYHGRCAGTLAMRRACEAGARKLIVIGVDGWPPEQYEYYVDGVRRSRDGANEAMAECIADLEASYDLEIHHESDGPVWSLLEAGNGD